MNPEYKDIFDRRGGSYHAAMKASPLTRREEFEALFAAAPPKPGEVVVDIPAGGAYLSGFLPQGIDYHPREITPGFSDDARVVPWDDDWRAPPADHIAFLAAAHHFEDHGAAFARCLDALNPGGVLHVGDVAEDSPIAAFLDGYVGAHTPTGHEGNYLRAFGDSFYDDFRVLRHETVDVPWTFASLKEAGAFAKALFGLMIDDGAEALQAMRDYGVEVAADGAGARIGWRLTYLDIAKA